MEEPLASLVKQQNSVNSWRSRVTIGFYLTAREANLEWTENSGSDLEMDRKLRIQIENGQKTQDLNLAECHFTSEKPHFLPPTKAHQTPQGLVVGVRRCPTHPPTLRD